jgi:hypothetical protein
MADWCELAYRQVPKYSSRSVGCFPESLKSTFWPAAARHYPTSTGCFPERSGRPAEETDIPRRMTAYG